MALTGIPHRSPCAAWLCVVVFHTSSALLPAKWTPVVPFHEDQNLHAIAWNGSRWLASNALNEMLSAAPGQSWRSPRGGSYTFRDAVTSSGGVTFVGASGEILTWNSDDTFSTDLITNTSWLNAIAANGSQFVAVGSGGRIAQYSSYWTTRTSGVTVDLNAVARSSGGTWIAAGNSGTILKSTTSGSTWTAVTSPVTTAFYAAAASATGNTVVIVGQAAVRSTNGGSSFTTLAGLGGTLHDVIWAGSQFVAVGVGGQVATSPDGLTWTSRARVTTQTLRRVAYGDSLRAVGDFGTVIESDDGVSWRLIAGHGSKKMTGVVHGAGGWLAVGEGGALERESADGRMPSMVLPGSQDIYRIVEGNGQFLAISGLYHTMYASTDGLTWQVETLPETGLVLNEIASGGGRTIAMGNLGKILHSSGGAWQTATGVTSPSVRSAAWDGTVFRAICQDGVLISSADGAVWSAAGALTGSTYPSRIRWLGDQWAVMDQFGLHLSTTAISWSFESSIWKNMMTDVARRPGGLVAVGGSGDIILSDGFESWLRTQGGSFAQTTSNHPDAGRLLVAYAMGLAGSDPPRWPTVSMPSSGSGTLVFETPNPIRKNLQIEVESADHPAGPWQSRWRVRPDGMVDGDPGTLISTPTFGRRRFQMQVPRAQSGSGSPREFFRVRVTPN